MKMEWEQHKRGAVMHLSGELTIDDAESMRRRCRQWIDGADTGLVVECSALERLDSAGLDAMLWLQEELDRCGLPMRIADLCGQPEIAIRLTRLDRRFQVSESVEAAARQIGGARWGGQAA
ncbi:MAG: STAS domain-containing protein [Phycisphaerales bacterium]|nr:STAS domain-containing protein [Phycisphaerales bacterium]